VNKACLKGGTIKNKTAANEVSALMFDIKARLDESAHMVQETCGEDEKKISVSIVARLESYGLNFFGSSSALPDQASDAARTISLFNLYP